MEEKCPVCFREFPLKDLEGHVNRCLFLHTSDQASAAQNISSKLEAENLRKRARSTETSPAKRVVKSPRTEAAASSSRPKNAASPSPFVHPYFADTKKKLDNNFALSKQDDSVPVRKRKTAEEPMTFNVPLAKQVAPQSLDDFFGQAHILGPRTVLRTLLEKGEIPNMILWGPPGCGKTSLSGVIKGICLAQPQKFKFHSLCAATCGIKDVQTIIAAAKGESKYCPRRNILFMDEIHRFNKKQQDIFLMYVERGELTLIGATTENPSFVMNSALLSRCRVIVFEKLQPDNIAQILKRAAKNMGIKVLSEDNDEADADTSENSDDSNIEEGIAIENSALTWLADTSDGDARIALTNLQLVFQHNNQQVGLIGLDDIKYEFKKGHMLYDRQGEEHYNIISAMHKSIRGSDDNAALYWTTRMIVSGEDPRFIARRLVRAASEDIGNADPLALPLAISTMQGCQLLGMPEADVLLAQCAIYLARAPKSREADSALAACKAAITNCDGLQPSVPMHLRNAPTKLMKELGYGKLKPGTSRSFMPEGMEKLSFF